MKCKEAIGLYAGFVGALEAITEWDDVTDSKKIEMIKEKMEKLKIGLDAIRRGEEGEI